MTRNSVHQRVEWTEYLSDKIVARSVETRFEFVSRTESATVFYFSFIPEHDTRYKYDMYVLFIFYMVHKMICL